MANLTLSIPDHQLALARKAAAARNTTVDALVSDYLARLTGDVTPEQQEAIDWMMAASEAYGERRVGPLPTREETYAERAGPRA